MDRSDRNNRRSVQFQPWNEVLERKQLLSGGTWPPYVSTAELYSVLHDPVGFPAVRPNTPVLPFGTAAKLATFIDPTANINNGYAVIVGGPSFIAPYSTLNAHGGIIKIGSGTDILDNATIVANPLHSHTAPAPQVLIGDHVLVSYGAQILGPSTIGAYGSSAKATEIGPGALIDQANIEPGAIVSALARVGPGVTVPSGYLVLPGKNVTTNAEASDPALGMVVRVTSSDLSNIDSQLTANQSLGTGYNTLYQGQSATGASPGVTATVSGIYNGNLATIQGANSEPGSATASTPVPSCRRQSRVRITAPRAGRSDSLTTSLPGSRAQWSSTSGPRQVAHQLGPEQLDPRRHGRADQHRLDRPYGQRGDNQRSRRAVQLTIGQNFVAGNNATILGGSTSTTKVVIGDNVTIGNGAVVSGTSLGSGSTVGDHALLARFDVPGRNADSRGSNL